MKYSIFSLSEGLEALNAFDSIVDVRSPAEFAEDHLPGAINCPVLDDAQRAEVGTLYKQVSPFEARKLGAAMVSENIARHLRECFLSHPKSWRPLIYCWRGGQRSGAMTTVLRQVGWNAHQLDGGYKAYRRYVVDRLQQLPLQFRYRVVSGSTGSGKSRVLQALAGLGEQVLDLEELARHKGSVLGILPGEAQPSQKAFESALLLVLGAFDPGRPVYVEAESRKIGVLQVPDALIEIMRKSPCLTIEAGIDARVGFLLRDYAYFLADREWLIRRLEALRGLRGNETVTRWVGLIREEKWPEFVADILENHYDPLYFRSQNHNYAGHAGTLTVVADDLSEAGICRLARKVVDRMVDEVVP